MKLILITMASLAFSFGALAKGKGAFYAPTEYVYQDQSVDSNTALAECAADLAKQESKLRAHGYTIVSVDGCTATQSTSIKSGIKVEGRISFKR
ncbi:MAG: hypothetical protein ACAH59_02085 [Pseudobdellovibrionaceae bacterium]